MHVPFIDANIVSREIFLVSLNRERETGVRAYRRLGEIRTIRYDIITRNAVKQERSLTDTEVSEDDIRARSTST